MNDLLLDCKWKNLCQSCSLPSVSTRLALEDKRLKLEHGISDLGLSLPESETQLISVGPYAFRNRVDLIWADGNLSFYDKDHRTFALDECPLLSPELNHFFSKVRKLPFLMKKGSLRLRVGVTGEKGLWLDLANLDVKALFDENKLLKRISEMAVVEIGQRRKSLVFENELPKLRDPIFRPWTATYADQQKIPLFSAIGSFSQTSLEANEKIANWIETAFSEAHARTIIEFGSGTGTLTFPAAGKNRQVLACENDSLALFGLRQTLQSQAGFADRIEIFEGDFQLKKFSLENSYDTFLINPPRSGMGKFHETLLGLPQLPQAGIYMSCFLESFLKDALELSRIGYRLKKLAIVDQFPFTHHFEILSSWRR